MLKFFIIFLSLSSIAMGGLLYHEVVFDADSIAVSTAMESEILDDEAEGNQPSDDVETTPLQNYKETLSRPLFLPERRPQQKQSDSPIAATRAKTTGTVDKVKLSAIIITSETKEAMFMQGRGGNVVRVKEGGVVGDLTLSKIEEDRVVLTRGDSSYELLLRVYQKPVVPKTRPTKRRMKTAKSPVHMPAIQRKGSKIEVRPRPNLVDPVSLKRKGSDSL